MKTLITILLTLFFLQTAQAMDESSARINAVKKNAEFLYGEATMPTLDEAVRQAYAALKLEMQAWAAYQDSAFCQHVDTLTTARVADTIVARRATMYHVLAYVKKSDLALGTQPQSQSQPQPALRRSADTLLTDSVKQMIRQRFFRQRHQGALHRIMQAKTFFELKGIMQPMKEQGIISDYGKYASAQHPEACYLIVYDPAGNIRALLDRGKDQRTNLKTGKPDSIGNYRGCGAIWFILNEE